MSFKSIAGFITGALITAFSKFFWLDICIDVSNTYVSLDQSTCNGFSTFFFYFGIFTMSWNVLKFFFKK